MNARHKRVLRDRRDAATQWNLDGRIASRSLLELSSVDMTVAFFHDRLEYRRRLGSRHGVIPYTSLTTVRLAQRPSLMINTKDTALEPFHARKDVILTVAGRRRTRTFDFRRESLDDCHRAMEIMRAGMSHGGRVTFTNATPRHAEPTNL